MLEYAKKIVESLRRAGFKAYFAGGCVRDQVMGREPQDYDIATDARPEAVMRLFPKTIPAGISFGVVIVLDGPYQFEVATFRSDGQYLDGRHPVEVHFSDEVEDARRRDFTINGMFYDPIDGRIVDYVEGQTDIKAGLIRCIGDPRERFAEDKLRLMRAVRFAAQFDYKIESRTYQAILDLASQITIVSAERIRDELSKTLMGPRPAQGLRMLHQTVLLKAILPEVCAMEGVEQPPEFHPEGDVWTHTLLMLEKMDPGSNFELALSVLLHDVGKPPTFSPPKTEKDRIRFDNHCQVGAQMSEGICSRLRLSRKQTEKVVELVREHLRFKDVRQMRESKLKRFLRGEHFPDHLELHRLDCLASHGDLSNWEFCKQKLEEIGPEEMRPERLVTGDDLIRMGYVPGRLFSEILTAVEDAQLEGQVKDREAALELIEKRFPLNKNK
ncbi:MAG: CCA tRNA nucleotidyltransferase [Nitrospiria bacterium]